jgi:hypothetical protein
LIGAEGGRKSRRLEAIESRFLDADATGVPDFSHRDIDTEAQKAVFETRPISRCLVVELFNCPKENNR